MRKVRTVDVGSHGGDRRPGAGAVVVRLLGSVALASLVLSPWLWGCKKGSGVNGNNNVNNNANINHPFDVAFLGAPTRDVDVLLVVDNSSRMEGPQATLQGDFTVLVDTLTGLAGWLPNLHVGVVTTDLGTGNYGTIRYCEEIGGDRGILGKRGGDNLGESCVGAGQRYLVDTEPIGCQIERDANGQCTQTACSQAECDLVQRGSESLQLVLDANGCPRCRNYQGGLEDAFVCLAGVGTTRYSFEQHLEAMYRAMDAGATPENDGFLRPDSMLVILTLSNEDDCSASEPQQLYNPDPAYDRIDSELGFLHSFRCFEFGVACDESGREPGPRHNCEPRDDPAALLHPVSRYTGFLEALRDPELLSVATIGGPFEGLAVVQYDTEMRPELAPACANALNDPAVPAIRLRDFTFHFNDMVAMGSWAFYSVCSPDYSLPLQGLAERIGSGFADPGYCVPQRLSGCPQGPGGTLCAPCLPTCRIFALENRETPDQKKLIVPWCGEVCAAGLCTPEQREPCSFDVNRRCICTAPLYPTRLAGEPGCAPLHFPNALPGADIDPDLETLVLRVEPTCTGTDCPTGTEGRASACWYLDSDPQCPHLSALKVTWADHPRPLTRIEGVCGGMAAETETDCQDGADNDEDCLTDAQDPDCQP